MLASCSPPFNKAWLLYLEFAQLDGHPVLYTLRIANLSLLVITRIVKIVVARDLPKTEIKSDCSIYHLITKD